MNTAENARFNAVKVAARIWLQGHGCRYLHTANVSAVDGQGWIEKISQDAAAAAGVHQCRVGNSKAYCVSIRLPDPNNPERKVTNLWLLVDPQKQLTVAHVEHFAMELDFSAAAEQFESWVNERLLQSSLLAQSPDVVTATHGRLGKSMKSRKAMVCGVLLSSAIGIAWWSTTDRVDIPAEPETEVETLPTPDARWDDEKVRDEMRRAISNAGDGTNERELQDVELLTEFVKLFRVSPHDMGLTDADISGMENRRGIEPPHPFIAFIYHFPQDLPKVDPTDERSWSLLCSETLRPLAAHFRRKEPGATSTQSLEESNPMEILRELRHHLHYPDFAKARFLDSKPGVKDDPWLETWDSNDPASQWQPAVRSFLKKRFGK